MKRGFTLVELSIVLVVIGLLIGGVLVAQSMIETSKIQAQVRQLQQFDAAVADFITKYNAMPGDFSGLYTSAEFIPGPGNYDVQGDGWITDYSANIPNSVQFNLNAEISYFWVQLYRGVGFTQDGAVFAASTPATGFDISSPNRNSPRAAIDSKTGIITASGTLTGGDTMTAYQLANYSSLITSGGAATNGIQGHTYPTITPVEATAIDMKMDDGIPTTGGVRATSNTGGTSTGFGGGNYNTGSCYTGTKYLTSSLTSCVLLVQVMSQAGGSPRRGTMY